MSLRSLASGSPGPAAALAARGWACTPSLSAKSIPGRETSTELQRSKGYLQGWGLCYLLFLRTLVVPSPHYHTKLFFSYYKCPREGIPKSKYSRLEQKKTKKQNKKKSLHSSLLVFVLLTLFVQFALLVLNDEENSHDATLLIVVMETDCRQTRLPAVLPRLPHFPSHLFEYEDTVPRADELRELSDATLVEVRPREAAVIEVDFGAAVFSVPLSCVCG